MAGILGLQVIQLGDEAVAGTPVAATAVWRGVGGNLSDDREIVFVPERVGIAVPTTRTYTPKLEGSLSMAATEATFEQLPYIFEAGISAEVASQDGVGAETAYIYNYQVGWVSKKTLQTYTLETGDNQQAEEMEFCFVPSFTLTGNQSESVMVSAEWTGRQVANATFTAALVPQDVEEILAAKGTLFIDAIGGTMGATQISNTLLSWELAVTTGWHPKYTTDSGQLYFDFLDFDSTSFDAILSVVFEHNATAVIEKNTNWRGEVAQLFRILIEGSAVATPGVTYSNKSLIIDMTGKWETFDALTDQDGNSVVNATMKCAFDFTPNPDVTPLDITVVNELTALV